jgi:hypothetical protein
MARVVGVAQVIGATAKSDWGPRSTLVALQLALAAFLGTAGYATLAIAVASVTAAWSLVDLGLGMFALRESASKSDLVRPIFGFYLLSSMAVMVLFDVVAYWTMGAGQRTLTFALCALYLPLYAAFPDWHLRGTGQLSLLARSNWLIALVTAIPLILTPFSTSSELRLLSCALSFGVAPGVAAAYTAIASPCGLQPSIALGAVPKLITRSLPIGVAGACMSAVAPLGLHALTRVASESEVGLFALGLRIATALAAGGWALGQNSLRFIMSLDIGAAPTQPRILRAVTVATAVWLGVVGIWIAVSLRLDSFLALGLILSIVYLPKYVGELVLISQRADWTRLSIGFLDLGLAAGLVYALGDLKYGPTIALIGAEAGCVLVLALLTTWAARKGRGVLSARGSGHVRHRKGVAVHDGSKLEASG